MKDHLTITSQITDKVTKLKAYRLNCDELENSNTDALQWSAHILKLEPFPDVQADVSYSL